MKKISTIFMSTALMVSCSFADDITNMQKEQEKKKQKLVEKIWESKGSSYDEVRFSMNEDEKLFLDEQGNIIMYVNKEYQSIKQDNFYKHVKFDTSMDKELKLKCTLIYDEKVDDKLCDHPFYKENSKNQTQSFSGLFSAVGNLAEGKVETTFSKYAFAKIIHDNKVETLVSNFLEQREIDIAKKAEAEKERIAKEQADQKAKLAKERKEKEALKRKLAKLEREKKEKARLAKEKKAQEAKIAKMNQEAQAKEKAEKEARLKMEAQLKAMQEELAKLKAEKEKVKEVKVATPAPVVKPEVKVEPKVEVKKEVASIQTPKTTEKAKNSEPKVEVKPEVKKEVKVEKAQNSDGFSKKEQALLTKVKTIKINKNKLDEFEVMAIESDKAALEHIPNPSKELKLYALQQNGLSIEYIKEPTEEMQLLAVLQNKNAVKLIKKPTALVKKVSSK